MAKLILSDISNLNNPITALGVLSANNDLIEAALENTLSRDGTSPNTMNADLDMNSNQILNLPDALTDQEPVTLSQLNEALEANTTEIVVANAVNYVPQTLTAPEKNQAQANISLVPGSDIQAFSGALLALANNTTSGFWSSSTGTGAARTLTGTANEITVTNGTGTAGNPTLSLPTALTFTGKTVTGGTFNSSFNGTLGATTPSTVSATTVNASGTAAIAGVITAGVNNTSGGQGVLNLWGGSAANGGGRISFGENGAGDWNFGVRKAIFGGGSTSKNLLIHNGALGVAVEIDISSNAIALATSSYLNWGTTLGTSGYGMRDNAGTIQVKNSGGAWTNIPLSGATQWTTSGSDINFTTGNVGIGTATPGNLLELSKAVAAGTVNYVLKLRNNTAGATNLRVGIQFEPTNSGADYGATIQARNDGVTGAGDLLFGNVNNAVPSEWMRIQYDGKVGIGITGPNHLLDVNGNIGLAASAYINWGTTDGTTGYGFRDNAGVLQIKNSGGAWTNIPTSGSATQWTTTGANIYFNTGNVGIGAGATAPLIPLTVNTNDTSITGALKVANSSTGDASMFFLADGQIWALGLDNSDTNKFKIGTDSINADVGVNTRLTIDLNGNVGIGTSSPQTLLQVGPGSAPGTGEATNKGHIILPCETATLNTAGSGGLEFKASSSGSGYGWKIASVVPSNADLAFGKRISNAAWTDVMRLTSNGAMVIGATTETTNSLFDVRGAANFTITNPTMQTLNYAFNPGGTFNTKGGVSITAEWTTGGVELGHALKVNNNIRASASQLGSSFAIEAACLVEQDWYDSGAILAYVGSPNVAYKHSTCIWGLTRGKATTTNTMHIFRATSESDSGEHPSVGYFVTASASDNFCNVGFQAAAAAYSGFLVGGYDANTAGGADPTYPFVYNSKTYGDLRFYVDNAACVNVRGTDNGSAALWIGRNNSGSITSVIRANGTFESAGGGAGGGYTAFSDRRLKENLVDVPSQLDKLNKLNVYQYNMIDAPEKLRTGVVAQEIQEQYSELVEEVEFLDKGKLLTVNTTDLMYKMLKGIQELTTRVKELENKLGEKNAN